MSLSKETPKHSTRGNLRTRVLEGNRVERHGKFKVIEWKFEKDYKHGWLESSKFSNYDFRGTIIKKVGFLNKIFGRKYVLGSIGNSGPGSPEDYPLSFLSTNSHIRRDRYIQLKRVGYETLRSLRDSNKNTFRCDYDLVPPHPFFSI